MNRVMWRSRDNVRSDLESDKLVCVGIFRNRESIVVLLAGFGHFGGGSACV
jgi:hypothetical protein